MAVVVVSTNMASGVVYTHTTDSSVDWPSVPNDVYFLDLNTDLVYYKDPAGTVIGAYDDAGLTAVATDGVSIIGDGTSANPLVAVASSSGNLLLTGGATYSGTGLTFDVSALTYLIAGVNYATIATQVTLNVGDPTFSRFDAIVVDELEVVSVIQGIPAGTPVTPSIEADQVLVQYVLVGINATTPTIQTEYVYREGSSPDWTTSVFGTNNTADFSSTTPAPYAGAQCVLAEVGQYGSLRGIRFSTGTPVSRSDYIQLSFWIYLTEDLIAAGKSRCYVFAWKDNAPVSADYVGYKRFENFIDMSLTGQWQLVSIPTAAFTANPSNTTIGYLTFTMWPNQAGNAPVEFALDEIKLSTGFGPGNNIATIDILENDTIIAPTARLNFIDGTDTIVTITDDNINNKVDVSIDRPFEIEDGGVQLQPTVSGINFTGAGVNLTTPGGSNPTINVNIPGGSGPGANDYITSSTQWSRSNTDEVILLNGNAANGCTFFTPDDIVAGGTTSSYNQIPLAGGIDVELKGSSGTINIEIDTTSSGGGINTYSEDFDANRAGATGQTKRGVMVIENDSVNRPYTGTANVNIDGTNYLMTASDRGIAQTIKDFFNTHESSILSTNDIILGYNNNELYFKAGSTCDDTVIDGITFTSLGGGAGTALTETSYTSLDWGLEQTCENWIASHKAALNALNVRPLYNGGSLINNFAGPADSNPATQPMNGYRVIRFCTTLTIVNTIAVSTGGGTLDENRSPNNPFTGENSGAYDHFLIPYVGEPYDGSRILHNFRVNFEVVPGGGTNIRVSNLSIRRFVDDSIIGSELQIFRSPNEGSQQYDFVTYTNDADDPFATGGFYFLLRNESTQDCEIFGNVGILLQNTFDKTYTF